MPFDVEAAIKEYKEGRSGKGQRKLVDRIGKNTKHPGQLANQQLGKARTAYADAAQDGGRMAQGNESYDTTSFNNAVKAGASKYGSVSKAQEDKLRKRLQAQAAIRNQNEQDVAAAQARGATDEELYRINRDNMRRLKGLR